MRQVSPSNFTLRHQNTNNVLGIKKIEILAKWEERKLIKIASPGYLASHTHLDGDERLELAVRNQVRHKFQAAMMGEAGTEDLEALERVFFNLTFPTPPAESHSKPSGHRVCAGGIVEAV